MVVSVLNTIHKIIEIGKLYLIMSLKLPKISRSGAIDLMLGRPQQTHKGVNVKQRWPEDI